MKRIIIIVAIIFTCISCDQSTKNMAVQNLKNNNSLSFSGDMIRLQYAENKGAFLGLGSQLSERHRFILFSIFVGLTLSLMLLYLVFSSQLNLLSLISFSIVLGGGISNLYDRLVNNGAVIDFLNVGIGSFRTGIFNVADMLILLGFFLLIFNSFKKREINT